MNVRIIKKALTLLIVDVIIIIGIFILQFRTDSSIIEKIGNLQLTFFQNEEKDKGFVLQNKFRLSYNGVNFFFDDQTPVTVVKGEQPDLPVTLESWQKNNELSYTLNFTNDIKVTFNLESLDENASLSVLSEFPPKSDIESLAIPFNYSSNLKVQKSEDSNIVLNNKKDSWEIEASSLTNGKFALNKNRHEGSYSIYQEDKTFTFSDVVDSPFADFALFNKNISNLKSNLISSFKANTNDANISEQVIVSYLAAQAENGSYSQALDDIPSGFKKSSQRTYLSAPYLNTLSDMNEMLEKSIADYENTISNNVDVHNLDIYTIRNISNYMTVHSKPQVIRKLLENTAVKDLSDATLSQVSGILHAYIDLVDLNPSYAKILVPVLPACIEKITQACSYENGKMTISENGTFLSVMQAVEIGFAVMRYGLQIQDEILQKAGYVLVNSYLSENSSFDLRTLANLYPIIAYDNWYYPHLQIINSDGDNLMWAWTCARDISYEKESDDIINITIDFPESLTHYVIIKGIPHFTTIYIYNMAFRTDPRFETYNSSGYVYKSSTNTLLLKSRHKSKKEVIRFDFKVPEKKAEPVVTKQNETDNTETKGDELSKTAESANTDTAGAAESQKDETSTTASSASSDDSTENTSVVTEN